jgi:GT2 family glycosyltransferase
MPVAHAMSIAAIVCTRNRGARFVGAVESILSGTLRPTELIVVDQSTDNRAREAGSRFDAVAGFRYCRVGTVGLSRARNTGIDLTRADIVAFIDDDCEASRDWLAGIVGGFERDARIGVVHGNVLAGPHDPRLGFIPSYLRVAPMLATSMREKHLAEGMGASMAVQRSTWTAVGGFDEQLGAGGRFRSAEDIDFTMRALENGFAVYETSQGHVVHSGFRSWQDGEWLIYDYLYGIGATYAKHLKCGQASALRPMARLAWRWVADAPVVDLGRTPSRLLRLRGFAAGFFAAAAQPVDPRSTRFALGGTSG